MEEENKVDVIPTSNEEGQPQQKAKTEFTQEQQEKVNFLIKQERMNVLTKLGISSVEEGKTKLESLKDFETYKTKAEKYDELLGQKKELESENAMLEVGIASDYKELVKNYFKGSNQDLTKESLSKFLDNNPKFKSQWINNSPSVQPITIGNPQPTEKPANDGYADFKKYTRY